MLGGTVKEVVLGNRGVRTPHTGPQLFLTTRASSVKRNYNAASVETGCEDSGQLSRRAPRARGLAWVNKRQSTG